MGSILAKFDPNNIPQSAIIILIEYFYYSFVKKIVIS